MTNIHGEKCEEPSVRDIAAEVFKIQKRIFRLSQEGQYEKVHNLQRRLVNSRSAKFLAVQKAAHDSRGAHTPGIDGARSLTPNQRRLLSRDLHLGQKSDPVRRVNIPKPGGLETRPLGIPTIRDRAHQNLIALALEPEWEARFSPGQFGFRKGRCCHDALINIRMNIQRTPKWVLDADIEKFFDRVSHEALIRKLRTYPAMEDAIRRILNAGVLEGGVFTTPESGTPQGGPLSPLLANIALSGLEEAIASAFHSGRTIAGVKVGKVPRMISYADDFVVLHESRDVIDACRDFIDEWLHPLGLNLSPHKTQIAHTATPPASGIKPGFDFLGCHIRQFPVGRHQAKPFFKGYFTWIGPSMESIKRIYAKCADIIDSHRPQKRRNAQYEHQRAKGKASGEEILIYRLNPVIRGWSQYHRPHNAKEAFGRLDHQLWLKLFRHLIKTHPAMSRKGIVATFFDGGNPWIFKVRGAEKRKATELLKAASIPIMRHFPVQSDRSFYDGDWSYWGKRMGRYPSIPRAFGTCLKRQTGRCSCCNSPITRDHKVTLVRDVDPEGSRRWRLVHFECVDPTRDARVLLQ